MLKGVRLELGRRLAAARLGRRPFAIVCNNCWGGSVYQDLRRPYNTPFVGLFVVGFAELVADFDRARLLPLRLVETSRIAKFNENRLTIYRYPLAMLGDAEMHFVHYESEAEAQDKWERRLARLPPTEQITFVLVGPTIEASQIEAFVAAPVAKKLLLTPAPPPADFAIPWVLRDMGADGTLFSRQHRTFDVAGWLKGRGVQPRGLLSAARLLLVR